MPSFAARASAQRHVRRTPVSDSQRVLTGAAEPAPQADADNEYEYRAPTQRAMYARPHTAVLSPTSTEADDMEVEDLAEEPSGAASYQPGVCVHFLTFCSLWGFALPWCLASSVPRRYTLAFCLTSHLPCTNARGSLSAVISHVCPV